MEEIREYVRLVLKEELELMRDAFQHKLDVKDGLIKFSKWI